MTNATNATFAQVVSHLRTHRKATGDDMRAVTGDTPSGLNSVFAYTVAVHTNIQKMGIDTTEIFALDRNPKVIKRFVQLVRALDAQTTDEFRTLVDTTTATIIYALHLTGGMPLTTDALHYIGAGLKEGKLSPETRGVSRRTVGKLFGTVGLSTTPTQTSRTVGAKGFLQLCGATTGEPGKQNQSVVLNSAHPLIVAFFAVMNKATDAQIDAVTAPKRAK